VDEDPYLNLNSREWETGRKNRPRWQRLPLCVWYRQCPFAACAQGMLKACCANPLGCLVAMFCPCCCAYYLRYKALNGDWSKYSCTPHASVSSSFFAQLQA
jgi:hypothetical protein